jgi:putative inorganic carbon (HCO3(-)) transporter
MINKALQLILVILFIFTPVAFGSMELWAFSVMELGILLLIVLWAIQNLVGSSEFACLPARQGIRNLKSAMHNAEPAILVFLSLFLILILFQLIPLPSGIVKILSPKTYELRHALAVTAPRSDIPIPHWTISFVPFATKVEFLKWLTLSGLLLFLLSWRFSGNEFRVVSRFIVTIFLMGVFESLYGMFEFFSGHHQILYLRGIAAVSGTFINRNYFAGYLLMVIPLSMGLFFSREANWKSRMTSWRYRLSSLDGKTLLIGFGVVVMILGLLFSASRMGILSLLLSFSLISLLFKDPRREKRFSRTSILILSLALLWGVWIGLDAVMGRFLNVTEDFKSRWLIWSNTFEILEAFPVFGSGLGTFSQVFPMYRSFYIRNLVTHAENDFLQLASEVGWVGIGLLLILFMLFFFKAVSGIRSLSHSTPQRYIGIGGLVGTLALMLHSLVERNLQIPANAFLFTFLWALVLSMAARRPGAKVLRED